MKRPGNFLLLRLRLSGWKFGLTIPFPLFVLEDAAESIGLLASMGVRLGRWFGRRRIKVYAVRGVLAVAGSGTKWEQLAFLPAAFIRALRMHGREALAEIRERDVHVSVRIV